MIRVRRGRGGWEDSVAGLAVVVALAAGLALAGCSAKKTPPPGYGTPGGPGGMGENGISSGNQSSLSQMQQGTLGTGRSGPLADIHFDYNDYTIRDQDGEVLRSNASWLTGHPSTRVQVEGHCDERGSEEYNIALGAKRAQAAKDYLVTLGIGAERVSTISYGKELPVCTEHDEDCWQQNRRDHFVISD